MNKNFSRIILISFILTIAVACKKTDELPIPLEEKRVIERDYFGNYNWIESNNKDISLLVYGREYLPMPFSILNNKEMVTDRSKYVMTPGRMPKAIEKGPGTYELSFIDEVQYFSLGFYNPLTKSLEQEIDLTDFLQENSTYKLSSPTPVGYQDVDGTDYISLKMFRLTDKYENEDVIFSQAVYLLLINRDTSEMKIIENPKGKGALDFLKEERLSLIDGTNIAIQNGIEIGYISNNKAHEIVIEFDKLPRNNSKLNAIFDNLNEEIASPLNNSQIKRQPLSFFFFSPENSLEVLSYFVEDDKEIEWEGVTMSRAVTIDGGEYEIHSVEEFIELYKFNNKDGSY